MNRRTVVLVTLVLATATTEVAAIDHKNLDEGRLLRLDPPEFTKRFPEAAAIFDNLHMLHDNIDDVLSSPERYPTPQAKRQAILRILPIYLHRNHVPDDRYAEYHGMIMAGDHAMMQMGPRPPSAKDVLEGRPSRQKPGAMPPGKAPGGEHEGHK